MKNTKGLTLTELILTLVLSAVLLFGAIQLIVSHTKFTTTLQTGIALSQEAVVITEHIVANVRNSKYVQIGANSLAIYDINDSLIGTYTWATPNLNYTPQGQAASLVSNKLDTLTLASSSYFNPPTNTQTKLLQITAAVKDPRFQNVGPKSCMSSAYSRIPGFPGLVQLRNSAGTTIKNRYSKIQDAINAAVSGDQVWVSYQNNIAYRENITIPAINLTLLGGFDTGWSLGDRTHETIIQDAGQGKSYVIDCGNSSNKIVRIDGFTIMNGNSAGIGASSSIASSNLAISNNKIANNGVAAAQQGGIYLSVSGNSSITIDTNTITGNGSNTSLLGGGIYLDASLSTGTCTVNNNVIGGSTLALANKASTGGGMYLKGTATITNNTVIGNQTDGIYVNGSPTIKNNVIVGNSRIGIGINQSASTGTYGNINISYNRVGGDNAGESNNGGGIMINNLANSKTVTISHNSILNNESAASSDVGGIDVSPGTSSIINIDRNEIRGNKITLSTAPGGSGISIACVTGSSGTTTVRSNLVVGNTSARYGGGIMAYVLAGTATVNIYNNTIINNVASGNGGFYGGGVFLQSIMPGSPCNIRSCIIYGNTPKNVDRYISGSTYYRYNNISYSDVDGGFTIGTTSGTETASAGTGNVGVTPTWFGVAPSWIDGYHLAAGTVGNNASIVDKGYNASGYNDPAGGYPTSPGQGTTTCDMGAYGGMSAYTAETDPDKYKIGCTQEGGSSLPYS